MFSDTSNSTFNLQNLYKPKETKTRQIKERQFIIILTSPAGRAATSSLTTSNSPRKRASLSFSSSYLSMRRRSRLTPGTVSMRPSKEAESWNSLKRQVETHPVVERDKPTYKF